MSLAVRWQYCAENPMLNVQRVRHKERGYRTWTEEDIELYRSHWATGTPQRIALEVLLHTGLRRSDAVRLGKQHRRGNIHVIGIKKNGETVDAIVPVHPTLEKHLATVPAGCLTYIVTERGIGRSEKAFTNWIIEAARDAGLPPHSSPHGLRKATCRRLAEAGCSATQIMAITGQSLSVVERYIRDFNRARAAEAAIAAISDPIDENEDQTKLANR
jgi:integrase